MADKQRSTPVKPSPSKQTASKPSAEIKPAIKATAKASAPTKPAANRETATTKSNTAAKPASATKPTAATAKPVATTKSTAAKPTAPAKAAADANRERAAVQTPTRSAVARTAIAPTANAEPVKAVAAVPAVAETKPAVRKKDNAAARTSTGAVIATAKKNKKEKANLPAVKSADNAPAVRRAVQGGAVPADDGKRKKRIIIVACAAAAVVVALLVLILVLTLGGNSGTAPLGETYKNEYSTKTKVMYSAEYLGETPRSVPTETQDEGFAKGYPTYGSTLNLTSEEKTQLIRLNNQLCATATRIGNSYPQGTYDQIGADGKLYLNGEDTGRVLYKHTGSVGMYGGNVADDEPAVIKKLTLKANTSFNRGYQLTGLYAPAGEIVKIEIAQEDFDKIGGGLRVFIGQALYNYKANNIWAARAINRMPVILNTLNVTADTATLSDGVYTAYVGSFLGGPIYIQPYSANPVFSVTISGAVRYSHFILGYTTPEEFAENAKSSAPYFDLLVWDNGVLHSGPKQYAAAFDYDDLYKAAVLWDKIALVSTQVNKQGIVFLYDPFVAAGAAVAFPGQYSVNCPAGWMSSSLNYNSFVNSGAWGNMHEYNHNFQGFGYGVGADGEVTNNSLNLVEYSLFTRISSARQIGNYGGAGLSGWNCYTSAAWALSRVNSGSITSTSGLATYATLLHNFGQDAYVKAARGRGITYFTNWGNVTHQNMSYFVRLTSAYNGGVTNADTLDEAQKDYPMFVPVSSVYQTGRSYMYDDEKRYITTMQPYRIQYGADFTLDLRKYEVENGMYSSGSIVLPDGFSFIVKKVSKPQFGSVKKVEDGVYKYTPDKKNMRSGEIIVTLGITKDDGAFDVQDVDIVIELEQSHEMNKSMLERTIYTYTESSTPATATEAFTTEYAGYTNVVTTDNINPTQNGNTEIWSYEALPENTVYEIKGKLHVDETAKYRIALRGRWDCALFISINSDRYDDYTLAAEVQTTATHANFYPNDARTYKDLADLKAGDWVYFRAVLNSTNRSGKNAYIGVGWAKFTPELGVMDEDGNVIGSIPESVSVTYANAYRSTYELPTGEFETEYFYTREYTYNYSNTTVHDEGQTVVSSNYVPWTSNVEEGHYDLSHLFDGKPDTYIMTSQDWYISAQKPVALAVDIGKTVTANRFTLYGWTEKNMANIGLPSAFVLELKDEDGNVVHTQQFTNVPKSGKNATVALETDVTFRYYSITITATDNRRFSLTTMSFSYLLTLANGKQYSPDDSKLEFRGDWKTQYVLSDFGHVNEGSNDAKMTFRFEGTRLALFAYQAAGYGKMEVTIDGKKVGTVDLGKDGGCDLVFLSDALKEGSHTVTVKCVSGKANIGSVVVW